MRKFKVITDRGAFHVEALNHAEARDKIEAQESGVMLHEIKDLGAVKVEVTVVPAVTQQPQKGRR